MVKKRKAQTDDEADFFGAPSKKSGRGRKPNPDRKPTVLVGFKVDSETYDRILAKAKAESNGNISAWLRHAVAELTR